jgi:MYXO-CTERM domain-containing protein
VVQGQFGGGIYDGFVSKLNPAGSAFLFGTYLGGGGDDLAYALAIDAAGSAYIVGGTTSLNFPLAGALQPAADGGYEGFVSKLNPTATALAYSTYLGGAGDDYAHAVQVDDGGSAYVAGYTVSTNFPVTAGAFQTQNAGGVDVFVSKLNPAGSRLIYSTYIGGSQDDVARGLTLDSAGHAYVAGSTASIDFPVTPDAVQSTNAGAYDALISELSADGASLAYGSYLGGTNSDYAYAIALDSSGNAWLGGQTLSTNFPTTPGAVQPALSNIQYQIFVASMDVAPAPPDAGAPDSGTPRDAGTAADGGTGPKPANGCGCAAAPVDAGWTLVGALIAAALTGRRRRM